MRLSAPLALMGLFLAADLGLAAPPVLRETTYEGWPATSLSNGLVEVFITPQIGGRIMQYRLGDKDYFWVNPSLRGQTPPAGGLGEGGAWLNWGGEKLWPAPQGALPNGWPGPPDGVLDGGPHALRTYQDANQVAVRLTSQDAPDTGVRFSRGIRLLAGTTKVVIDATMTNTATVPRSYGIWTVAQHDCVLPDGDGLNPQVTGFAPLNPESKFADGYRLLGGLPDNPTWSVNPAAGLLQMRYQHEVGKVGLDSVGGWAAVVDGLRGYAFVSHFTPSPGLRHPDDSSVEFWSNGGGKTHPDATWEISYDPAVTPYYIESELLGPLVTLAPGESTDFTYTLAACNLGGDYPVLAVTDHSLTSEEPRAVLGGSAVHLSGRFGVFQPGVLRATLFDAGGRPVPTAAFEQAVSPLEPVVLAGWISHARRTEGYVEFKLFDTAGKLLDDLGRVPVFTGRLACPPPRAN